MSLLHLLVLASAVAAVAFFLAGFFLRSPRDNAAALRKEIEVREALAVELMSARSQRATAEQDLAEIKALGAAAESVRALEEERRIAAEGERDRSRKQLEQLHAEEFTLTERLRVAEEKNRATFEREEKTAAAWQTRLAQAQAERQQQELALRKELESLRTLVASEKAEQQRLLNQVRQVQAQEAATRRSLDELRFQSQAQGHKQGLAVGQEQERLEKALRAAEQREQEAQAKLAQERERLEKVARAAEQRGQEAQAKLAQEQERLEKAVRAAQQREQEAVARVAQEQERQEEAARAAEQRDQGAVQQLAHVELEWQAKAAAAEAALRAQLLVLQTEMAQLTQQVDRNQTECLALREQNGLLALAASSAQEELAQARAQSRTVTEALRTAEAGLADRDHLAQENAELREEKAHAE
ncbi:MAG TPA: hypothetical protein VF518_00040, partial [Polyangia bacterium]